MTVSRATRERNRKKGGVERMKEKLNGNFLRLDTALVLI
jgi:hypothetical protein